MRRRIGIDVGGTNTDAVLLEDDARRGRGEDAHHLRRDHRHHDAPSPRSWPRRPGRATAQAVMIGTTHFTNAVVQRRDLGRVAAVRIGLPSGASLPPFVDWPEDLADLVRARGGHAGGRPRVRRPAAGALRRSGHAGGGPAHPRGRHHLGGGGRGVLARSTPRARRRRPRSSPRSAPGWRSPSPTGSGASACWSARTRRCSTPA